MDYEWCSREEYEEAVKDTLWYTFGWAFPFGLFTGVGGVLLIQWLI